MELSVESFDVYCQAPGIRLLDQRSYEALHWPEMRRQVRDFRLVEVRDGITNRLFHLVDPHRKTYVSDQQNIRFSEPLPQWLGSDGKSVTLPEQSVSYDGSALVVGGMKNHWHFLINFLPRMILARTMMKAHFESLDHVVLHAPTEAQKSLLTAMFPELDFVFIPANSHHSYQFERLFYLDLPQNLFFAEEILQMTREAVLSIKGSPGDSMERIFVDRDPQVPRRRLAAREGALNVLQRHRITPIFCEDYDIFGQISIFSRADVVGGLHGAGMANMLFCRPSVPVLIIDYKWPSEMYALAQVMGLKAMPLMARQVPTEGATDPRLRDLHVTPKALDSTLTALLDLAS